MPRRIFKSLTRQRQTLQARWFMRPFRLMLGNASYWTLNRRNVTRAFALGLFIAWIPLPINIPLAVLLALLLRLNIPAAVTGTLITNPLTAVPLYYTAYWVGSHTLQRVPRREFAFDLSWEWLTTGLLPIWKPFLLGCLIMGLLTALTGYILVGLLWHLSLVKKYRRRKDEPNAKDCAIDKK